MSDWENISFKIQKQQDKDIHRAVLSSLKNAEITLRASILQPFEGESIRSEEPESDLRLTKLFTTRASEISKFAYLVSDQEKSGTLIKVMRCDNDLYDEAILAFNDLNFADVDAHPSNILKFILFVKEALQEIPANQSIDTTSISRVFSNIQESFALELSRREDATKERATEEAKERELKLELQGKEQELAIERLELKQQQDISLRNDELLNLKREHNKKLDEAGKRYEQLEKEHKYKITEDAKECSRLFDEAKKEYMKETEETAAKHSAEIKSYRDNGKRINAVREDFRSSIAQRSERLGNHPKATGQPIFWIYLLLLAIFGICAVISLVQLPNFEENSEGRAIALVVFFGLAFVGTIYYLLRWSQMWNEQQSMEEIELRRMYLDMDRLYLAVEVALDSKGADKAISDSLLEEIMKKPAEIGIDIE